MDSIDYKSYKVAVCGARATGKSSLCSRLTDRDTKAEYNSTIGVDLMVKYLPEYRAKIHFWDLAGDIRFESITSCYIKGVDLLLFVYNLEEPDTVRRLEELDSIYKNMGWLSAMVVGTHKETHKGKFMSCEDVGKMFADDRGYSHFTVALKENKDVSHVLDEIVRLMIPIPKKEEKKPLRRESYDVVGTKCAIM